METTIIIRDPQFWEKKKPENFNILMSRSQLQSSSKEAIRNYKFTEIPREPWFVKNVSIIAPTETHTK